MDKVNVLVPNDIFPLPMQGKAKSNLHDYQGSLKNLNGGNVLQPLHDDLTLKVQGEGKRQLGDYEGALEDLNKVCALMPNWCI